jgi:hypothetical protein
LNIKIYITRELPKFLKTYNIRCFIWELQQRNERFKFIEFFNTAFL